MAGMEPDQRINSVLRHRRSDYRLFAFSAFDLLNCCTHVRAEPINLFLPYLNQRRDYWFGLAPKLAHELHHSSFRKKVVSIKYFNHRWHNEVRIFVNPPKSVSRLCPHAIIRIIQAYFQSRNGLQGVRSNLSQRFSRSWTDQAAFVRV